MSIGEELELDNEYKMTFEDGTNKKPIIVDVDDPFNDQATGSLIENDVISDEGDVNDPFQ